MARKKISIVDLQNRKADGRKITMMTAYDHPTARLVAEAGIDTILVGDSLGMVVLGYSSTVPVTMEEMIHHCRAVSRGAGSCFVIGDLPFMSYQVSIEKAVENAGRLVKEAGCDAVKLEGGSEMAGAVRAIVQAGIPVCGHIGLTPQSATKLGGFKVQGRDLAGARELISSAGDLEEAGAFMLVMECIPDQVSKRITGLLKIPTIGIGAGIHCDGQVLVYHDAVGLFDRFKAKFVKRYAELSPLVLEAIADFRKEVEGEIFPGPEHSFTMDGDEAERLWEGTE